MQTPVNIFRIIHNAHRSTSLIYVILYVLAVCLAADKAKTKSESIEPQLSPYAASSQLPLINYYYQPIRLFSPEYGFNPYPRYFFVPQLPGVNYFPLPSGNVTTVKPDNKEPTTAPPSERDTDAESVTTAPKINKTETNFPSFYDIFKKSIIPSFAAENPIVIPNHPVYPTFYDRPIDTNVNFYNGHDHFYDINNAYGLTGFRPFFYDALYKHLNDPKCTNSTEPCDSTISPSVKSENIPTQVEKSKIIEIINRIYKEDPNIVIFNTKEPPLQRTSDEPEDQIDIRIGKETKKGSKDPFYDVYKDLMFLNKSFLSTWAPYLHK